MSEETYALLVAHLVGDFALQTDRMVAAKRRYGARGVLPHAGVIGLLSFLAVLPRLRRSWWAVATIVMAHLLIDSAKVSIDRRVRAHWLSVALFLLDQVLHGAVLFGVTAVDSQPSDPPLWNVARSRWQTTLWFLVATFVSGILLRVLLPAFGWPNRWPATVARAATFLLTRRGQPGLAAFPALAALAYHHGRHRPLTQAAYVEAIAGTLAALLCGHLSP